MKRYLWSMLLGLAAISAKAQTAAINGVCENGGRHATVSGLNATNFQLGVIPSCTITVYLTGTTNKATIYADSINTPLANPFTGAVVGSTAPGQWLFYAATGVGYDVVMSGGIAPNTFPTPVTLTDLQSGGGGGGGGVSSFSAGNLLPLFTTTVTNATTAPNLAFTFSNTGTLNFFGQVGGSTGPPSFIHFVAGSNITLTPSGGNTLTFAATGGGSCGPLAGDVTSTNCGTNNLGTPPSGPAYLQAFGDNNLNTVLLTHEVAVGNSNGNSFPYHEFVGIGDTNGAAIPTSSPQSNDIIGIGNNNIATVAGSIPDLICIGDENCQTISWLQDSVGIGNANFQNNIGTSDLSFLSEAVAIGLSNIEFVNNGESVIGIGQDAAGGCGPAQGDFCTGQTGSSNISDVISIGDASGNTIGSNVNDVITIGDAVMDSVAPSSSDIVGIGDAALQQCEISGSSSCASLSIPTPTAMSEVIGIGTLAGAFDQGSNIVAIGLRTVGGGGTAAPIAGNSGTFNVGVGDNALAKNTTGSNNVGIGPYAGADGYVFPSTFGNSNKTGSNNTWIGYDSGPNTTTQLSNTIALGYQSHVGASNSMTLGNSSITSTTIYGLGTGCLSVTAGVVTGSGSSCGTGGGGASNVTVNGGSTLTTANFNGSTPAAGTNGINVTWQASGSSVSAEVVGDGVSTHFLNGTGAFSAPAGSGTVTSIATTSPLGGGTITTSGTLTCTTCVVASSPAAGLAHFAGSTQTVTSSAANLASADVTGLLPHANIASTAVTPGSYTSANITVAADGSITAASNGSAGGVTSTSNSDGTLTISPTTGAVVASLALGHANTWTAVQTFTAGSGVSLSVGAFSTLATCGSGTAPEGTVAGVNDSTTNTWGATIAGSGSLHVMAYCDGSGNWTVAAK